jgi:saccharopine dehydrogenase-like NADP-dependent oxidoreductase
MHNDVLGDICIASRTKSKCDAIIDSIKRLDHIKDQSLNLSSRQLDALDTAAVVRVIEETQSQIVLNLGQSFVNMSVLEACLHRDPRGTRRSV